MWGRLYFFVGLFAFAGVAHSDELYYYDSFKCIPSIGLFEVSKLEIYNRPSIDEALGFYPTLEAKHSCALKGNVDVEVAGGKIRIVEKGETIFDGDNMFDRVRVFVDVGSLQTVEFCFLPSQQTGNFPFKNDGGCLFRGFPAMKADGPRSSHEIYRLIKEAGGN